MAIYVHHNSQQLGPYTVAEVKSQLASGALSIHDHVWWKGQQSWMPLGASPVLETGFKDPEGTAPKKTRELTGRSQFSIATLIAGLISFPFFFFASVPAIVLGYCGMAEIKKNPKLTGRGMLIAGMALGYFWTLVGVVVAVLFFYFHDEVEAQKERDDIVHSDVLVPPIPAKTPAPVVSPAPAPAVTSPTVTNLDQPLAPTATDASTNSTPAK